MPAGCGVWIGRPFASNPLTQFTFTNGLPEQELPVVAIEHVEVAVAIRPQHRFARRAPPVMSASTGTCTES